MISRSNNQIETTKNGDTSPNNSPTTSQISDETDYTATFEIYTNGTKRIFTNSMYHNLSPDVYIESPNPHIINVKKTGITWSDFFNTLPMKLTKDCLVTGTKQTFCSSVNQKLRFILNNIETPNALDLEIINGDYLLISYGK